MAKSDKFGTFGGVFTPSILTILGVIMYLRLPWVVGHAGVAAALGIVLVAHVISITTGLSISSIATDKNVGAGGPYYIVSRSLGLPIGGTLGIALFLGLCFSMSLYVIGFCESFLSFLEIDRTPTAIRIAGTITAVVLTAITVISTAFAIKTQYVILTLIAISLVSIFLGDPTAPKPDPSAAGEAPSLAILFGIFFPAVTGFTAGVNMSGDLKDPKSAIPKGTLAAIGVGFVVYAGLVLFLGTRTDAEVLRTNGDVLVHMAAGSKFFVFGGIWGATLSSGIGSIMGAPRILQALGQDAIAPRIFAKGHGKSNEPRNALVLAFLIAEGGILIAELDAIARVVSMVFLTMYAFLNICCAIESMVSPDFRPAFRIPTWVSILGATTSIVIMIQLDLIAMLGATVFMVGLFLWLQRKQLQLEAGDAWGGVWSSLIRSGLYRLTNEHRQQRNWRPNIISFRRRDEGDRLVQFGEGLMTGSGILTDFEMVPPGQKTPPVASTMAPRRGTAKKTAEVEPIDERAVGLFRRPLKTDDPYRTIPEVYRNYGFSGLEPNALLVDWSIRDPNYPGHLLDIVDGAADHDFNILVYKSLDSLPAAGVPRRVPVNAGAKETIEKGDGMADAPSFDDVPLFPPAPKVPGVDGEPTAASSPSTTSSPTASANSGSNAEVTKGAKWGAKKRKLPDLAPHVHNRIDVWWRADAGNIAFSLALLRFLTRSPRWERSQIRFLLISQDTANNDNLRTTLRRVLRSGRVEATIKVFNDTFAERTFEDRVAEMSSDAALTIIGLPNDNGRLDQTVQDEMARVMDHLQEVLLIRGSSMFEELLPTGREAVISRLPPMSPDGERESLPQLVLSEVPDLNKLGGDMAAAYQKVCHRLHEHCIQKVYGRHIELVRDIRTAAERYLKADKNLSSDNERKRRNAFNRLQTSFLHECRGRLERFETKDLPDLRAVLDGGIDAFLYDDAVVGLDPDEEALVHRPREHMTADPKDSRYVRRFKRRRRWGAWLRRDQARYRIPVGILKRFYHQQAMRQVLEPSIREVITETHQLIVQLGRVLSSSRGELPESADELERVITEQREHLIDHLDDLSNRGKELVSRHQWTSIVQSIEITQKYVEDIDRYDLWLLVRKDRAPAPELPVADILDDPEHWEDHQTHLARRAALALSLGAFRVRLTTIARRERDAIQLGIKNGALRECERLVEGLRTIRAELTEGARVPEEIARKARTLLVADFKTQFDPKALLDTLTKETADCSDEVPQTIQTISDDSVQALEEGRTEQIEHLDVPVRRLAQFLVESELVLGLQEAFADVPRLEQQAMGVAQDVVRLITFHLGELEAADNETVESVAAQLSPAIDSGIDRLGDAMSKLRALGPSVAAEVDERLHRVFDGCNAYDLSTASGRLDQHIRLHQGKRAVTGARGWVRRGVDSVRQGLVRLVYRRTDGVLLARERRREDGARDRVVDQVSELVQRHAPRPEVLEQLPFYYRQLFLGQSAINDSFWVERREQIARGKQALRQFDRGTHGAIFVVGDRFAGKTALLQRLNTDVFGKRNVVRVHAPLGGSSEPRVFERALRKALDDEVDGNDPFAAVPSGSVVILDDLQLWWDRSLQGMSVLTKVLDGMDRHGARILFVVALETHAYRFLHKLVPVSDHAIAVLECGPLGAEALQSVVTLRHGSTGMKFQLGAHPEDELGAWALARLFSSHFDYSRGNVGVALRAWVANIKKAKGDVLEIAPPTERDWEVLDRLRPSWVALLLQLVLHKQMSLNRLRRVTGLEALEARKQVDALMRMGLVTQSRQRVVEIDPAVYHLVESRLVERGYLA